MNRPTSRIPAGPIAAAAGISALALAGLAVYVSMGASYSDARPRTQKLSELTVTAQQSHAYLLDCSRQRAVMPTTYTLACGDANSTLEDLTWRTWTSRQALGGGTYVENNCTPDCADGKYESYPVTIEASDPKRSGQESSFGTITLTFTANAAPSWVKDDRAVFDVTLTQEP